MKTIITAVALLLGGAVAVLAQPADIQPNGIGIYFDEGAIDGSWCADVLPGSQVTAYLCLTRANDQSGFTEWEARLEHGAGITFAGFQIRGGGVNAATAPEFVVSFGSPLPYTISTVLLDITIDVDWEWSSAMRVWPADNPRGGAALAAYATVDQPTVFRTLQPPWGWDPLTGIPNWCASINDPSCLTNEGPSVPVEDVTWGGIKSLYR